MSPSPETGSHASGAAGPPTPPGPDEAFDIGSTGDSIDRLRELYARYGDLYRVYAPGRKSFTYVINAPEDVKRVFLTNRSDLRVSRSA